MCKIGKCPKSVYKVCTEEGEFTYMKKRFFPFLLFVFVLFSVLPFGAFAEETASVPPQIVSEAAILIDQDSGRVLFEQDADKRLYPASTTKIMTATLALENLQLDSVVVASNNAVMSIPSGASNMGILEGEQLTVKQLLYGVLVQSANEACNVLAEYMCGDVDTFVAKMNEKAQELGMQNTKFLNPHGLHSPEHYSTARDLAILARYAMQNETFREMVSTAQYIIEPTNKYTQRRVLNNTNYLISTLQNASYYYSKATGIKTGYTSQAGNCLVSSASQAGTNLIAVTLHAEPQADAVYSFIDSKALFEYGFSNYETRTIVKTGDILAEAPVGEGQGVDAVALSAKTDLQGLLPSGTDIANVTKTVTLNENILAPIAAGDVLGKAVYSYDGYELGTVELTASTEVKRDLFIFMMNRIFEFFNLLWVKIPLIILIVLILVLWINRRIKRKRRRRYLRSKRY